MCKAGFDSGNARRGETICTGVKHVYIKINLLLFCWLDLRSHKVNAYDDAQWTQLHKHSQRLWWSFMAEVALTCWVEIPSPTCHVYFSCALLFYLMYNTPAFSLYCEGCLRPLDLGANTFWEALQWEFEMMHINYSYPGIHQSCALHIISKFEGTSFNSRLSFC